MSNRQHDEERHGFLDFMETVRMVAVGLLAAFGVTAFVVAVFSLEKVAT